MIGKPMQDAMNEQINKELFSSYLYLSMAAYFEEKNLSGFGNWMRVQAEEEREHAMKFYDFILETGGKVTLKAIDAPKTEWNSNLEVAEEVAAHAIQLIHDGVLFEGKRVKVDTLCLHGDHPRVVENAKLIRAKL